MSRETWVLIGLLLGIPVGIGLWWWLTTQRVPLSLPKTYSNLEEWQFMKDERDRIIGVTVKRTAEET